MSDMNGQRQNWGRRALKRLRANGWLLASAALAVIAAFAFANLSPFIAPLAIIALVVAVAALPRQTELAATESAISSQAGFLPQLSAENLAAAVTDPLIVFDHTATVVHANAAAVSIFGGIAAGMSLPLKFRAPEMQALIDGILAGGAPSQAIDYLDKLP
ncbi:MAG: two-component sensor histidine kinase, partial [Mesorhizobium sp.]|nr:two-component sensor histidine kinase [Mesorhizobium sp.]